MPKSKQWIWIAAIVALAFVFMNQSLFSIIGVEPETKVIYRSTMEGTSLRQYRCDSSSGGNLAYVMILTDTETEAKGLAANGFTTDSRISIVVTNNNVNPSILSVGTVMSQSVGENLGQYYAGTTVYGGATKHAVVVPVNTCLTDPRGLSSCWRSDDLCQTQFSLKPKVVLFGPPSVPPDFFDQVIDVIQNLVRQLLSFFGFAVVAPDAAEFNQPVTTTVTLSTATPPDLDFTDGTATKYFGIVFVSDQNENVVFSQNEEVTAKDWEKTFVYTPKAVGKYVFGGILVKTETTYNFATQSWNAWSAPVTLAEDKKVVSITGIQAPPPQPAFDFGAVITGFLNSIRSFLCGTFNIFC